MKNFI